ncbi:MAG: ATP-dependent sacrificial sulfur transferase LarE [Desulfobulbales bacterium]
MTAALAEKKRKLEQIISRKKRVAVACSGGVDSTLLLRVALDVLGRENIIAVLAETPLLPPGEADEAKRVINHIGSRLLTVGLNPLAWPEFVKNPSERCYLCKKRIYQVFFEKLTPLDFNVLMDGTNLDDLSDYRPGLKALRELQIITPLADTGLRKYEIRQLSRDLGLPTWNKYSSSCLATRVATGQEINEIKLETIKKCESFLHAHDFKGCRARITDSLVTIELQEKDIARFAANELRRVILKKFSNFSIKRVLLDIKGRQETDS